MALTGIFGIWAVIGLTSQETISVHDDVYFTWIIFFVIILGSSLVLRLRNQYELEKELVRLQEVEKELLQREYTVLNNAYSVNARMFHDFHNHIGVLRQLLASDGGQEKATLYLNELSEPMDAISKTVWTGDETVDYLINSKLAAAQSAQIHTEINVEFPSNSNIRAHDLCAILGNLLDNALEACQRMAGESEQFITLTIRRINNMLIIKVRNSASDAPRSGEKGLESTKADGGLHGWGIKSIAAAADKYDGVIQTEYDNHVFQSVVSLSFEGVAIKE
jgi:sensor histidine kinase regulating citrate/malate metabolism